MRRAVVSIAANIAEGSKRKSTKDLCHFLTMAESSDEEVKCLLILALDLGFLSSDVQEELLQECASIGAMLHRLIQALEERSRVIEQPNL